MAGEGHGELDVGRCNGPVEAQRPDKKKLNGFVRLLEFYMGVYTSFRYTVTIIL